MTVPCYFQRGKAREKQARPVFRLIPMRKQKSKAHPAQGGKTSSPHFRNVTANLSLLLSHNKVQGSSAKGYSVPF